MATKLWANVGFLFDVAFYGLSELTVLRGPDLLYLRRL